MHQDINLIPAGSTGAAPTVLPEGGALHVVGHPQGPCRLAPEAHE